MSDIDFSDFAPPKRKPTKAEKARYFRWVNYLKHSQLSNDEIHRRASNFAQHREPPKRSEE